MLPFVVFLVCQLSHNLCGPTSWFTEEDLSHALARLAVHHNPKVLHYSTLQYIAVQYSIVQAKHEHKC